jgi:hypothetical protein
MYYCRKVLRLVDRFVMYHLRASAARAKRAPALSPGLGPPPREIKPPVLARAAVRSGAWPAPVLQPEQRFYLSRDRLAVKMHGSIGCRPALCRLRPTASSQTCRDIRESRQELTERWRNSVRIAALMANESSQIRYDKRDQNGDACCERIRTLVRPRPSLGRHASPSSDEKDWIGRTRAIAPGQTNVCKHAIVDVPSITAESQTINPQVERKFLLKGVNLIEGIAHDSLPTLSNPLLTFYCGIVATDVICSTKTALSTFRGRRPGRLSR